MSRILVLNGEQRGLSLAIQDELSIGRSSANGLRLNGTQISREHARIFREGGVFHVADLESRNGIFVNGEKVARRALKAGDEIQVGNFILVFDPPYDFQVSPAGEGQPVVVRKEGHAHEALVTAEAKEVLAQEFASRDDLAVTMDVDALLIAHRRLRAVYQVGTMINQILDIDDLLNRVVELVLDILRGDRCVILLSKGEELKVAAVATAKDATPGSISISKTVLDLAWGDGEGGGAGGGKAILSDDVQHDERFDGSESLKFDSIRSLVCAPLEVQKERLGVLYVDVRESKTSYAREDLSLLVTIANQAAGAIQNARRYTSSQKQNLVLRERLNSEYHMVGDSPQIREVFAKIEKVAASDATVLIKGETGTGKELVARAVHDLSPRRAGPFVAVNCAAMTESLLESELFGHEKGAFTGAVKDSPGKFELADGGTLFLDEIGEMSAATQTKLLRVLQERSFHRVGGTKLVSIDVRILSATNKDLEAMIRETTFRQDLFYRLAVVPLALPPLRERPGDVQLLAAHFLDRFNAAIGKSTRGFENEAMKMLRAYHWPGNVRELRNVVERIVVLCDKEWIGVEDLPANMTGEELKVGVQETINAGNLALPEIIARTEKLCIELALKKAKGKKVEAARVLKISRPTLDKKIREYEIEFSK